jgi:hypothetical protein
MPKANLKILTWNIQMLPTFGFSSDDLQKKARAARALDHRIPQQAGL